MRLATGDAMSWIEVPSDIGLFVAHCDVDNCFHRLRMTEEMSRWFTLPPIEARFLGIDRLDGFELAPSDLIYPALTSLPLGFSWSLYFAQRAHENVVSRAPGFSDGSATGKLLARSGLTRPSILPKLTTWACSG